MQSYKKFASALAKAKRSVERDKNEARFEFDINALGIETPKREYRFVAERLGKGPGLRQRLLQAGLSDWRFDFAWPQHRLAFEIEGAPGFGRHTTAKGFIEDCRKYNQAQLMGWIVYRIPGPWVRDGQGIALLQSALKKHYRQCAEIKYAEGRGHD